MLEARNIAYNIVLERSPQSGASGAYLYPRYVGHHTDDDMDFHPGYPELSGHIVSKNRYQIGDEILRLPFTFHR